MTSVFTRITHQGPQTFKGENRRIAKRYGMRTAMQYRTSDGELKSVWKVGHTLDMSVGGILIDIPPAIPVGATLELAIDWTGLYHGKPMVRLVLIGSVMRNDSRGTALRILSHQFRDARPAVIPSRRLERDRAVA
jgi:hypothetical protein